MTDTRKIAARLAMVAMGPQEEEEAVADETEQDVDDDDGG